LIDAAAEAITPDYVLITPADIATPRQRYVYFAYISPGSILRQPLRRLASLA